MKSTSFETMDYYADKSVEPELNLLSAIIQRCYFDATTDILSSECSYKYNRGTIQQMKRNAYNWFFRKDKDPFSYRWCCENLDLNPKIIQKKLKSVKCR